MMDKFNLDSAVEGFVRATEYLEMGALALVSPKNAMGTYYDFKMDRVFNTLATSQTLETGPAAVFKSGDLSFSRQHGGKSATTVTSVKQGNEEVFRFIDSSASDEAYARVGNGKLEVFKRGPWQQQLQELRNQAKTAKLGSINNRIP